MHVIEVFTEIDAPPGVVWNELLDFESYPEWNPFISWIVGEPAVGERLRLRFAPPGSRGVTFQPEVLVVDEPHRFAWLGRPFVPLVFDGYHEFHLDPIDGDRTRLLQRETFRGALVPALLDEEAVERGFAAMNEALKRRVERRVAAV